MTGGLALRDVGAAAHRCADAGFSGLEVTEAGRTAYLTCAAAALSGADVDLATGVAVAFPRSPMVTASNAWELAEVSGGRFRLGLGTQVRAHIERRYSAPFDPPGPRLREYVQALKAIFAAFRGERALDFDGEYYRFSLLPPTWSPGPIAVDDPPVDVAAVNPWMLRMAAAHADGVHVHPLNTTTYYKQTLIPNVGAAGSGFALFVPVFTVVGDSESERKPWRETARAQVAFYGSTPNYAFIFEQLGFPGTTERSRAAQKAGDVAGMTAVITDDLLAHFVVEGTWGSLPSDIEARCEPLAGYDVRVVLYQAGAALRRHDGDFERLGEVARALRG